MSIAVIGIDIGKNCFHLHIVYDGDPKPKRKKLTRNSLYEYIAQLSPCILAMEACGGAHHLARKFISQGHSVKLISPQFVKPFLKSNKNDYNDAEAIAEAACRPSMRFVTVKSEEQQSLQLTHRFRQKLVRQRTALINEVRGALLEVGITLAQGAHKVRGYLPGILADAENSLCQSLRALLAQLYEDIKYLDGRIAEYDQSIEEAAESEADCQRLITVPGIGSLTAVALHAAVGDAKQFKSGREMSAWIGLTPRQYSTGGKPKLSGISKRGDRYLRTLLIHCARSIICRLKDESNHCKQWALALKSRSNLNVAVVALANKLARIAWAVITKGECYKAAL